MIAAAAFLTAGQPESVRQTDSAIRTEAVFISRPCNTDAPPAQFFLCPRRPRHAQNTRGLRLVWLLAINNQLRRAA